MKFRAVISAWLLLSAFAQANGQATTPENFDDLAGAASSVLDSDPGQAADLYRKALDLRPSWAEGWFYLGGALFRVGKYNEARDAFRKGLDLKPDNGTAWGFLGLCDYELKQFDNALADIGKGEQLGLGSNHEFETAVRQGAAVILVRGSRFDQAMAQLQPLTKYNVDSPGVIEVAGLCALAESRMPEDLPERRRAVVALAGKGLWADTRQQPKDAEQAFHELITTYPDEVGVHYAYGLFLMDSDQAAALAEFQKEVSAHPTHWPSLLISAFLQTRQGTPELALKSAQEAEKLAPVGYRWLAEAETGRALLTMGQVDKAIPHFEESIRLEPGNAQTHFYLEQAYRRAGRSADAQRARADFVRLKAQQDPASLPGLINSTQR